MQLVDYLRTKIPVSTRIIKQNLGILTENMQFGNSLSILSVVKILYFDNTVIKIILSHSSDSCSGWFDGSGCSGDVNKNYTSEFSCKRILNYLL